MKNLLELYLTQYLQHLSPGRIILYMIPGIGPNSIPLYFSANLA